MIDVEEKVVSLLFNNAGFEKGVAESSSTLEKFSAQIDRGGILEKSVNGMSDILSSGGRAFSALETMATGALMNIGAKIENYISGKFRELVTAPVQAGFGKYEEKTSAVQTIMAAGYAMDDVSKALDTLNQYTDETSYSFGDMVNNIGKFTAQGIKLDDAASAMKGIANWAAVSGQGVQGASRAMYNLAQAIGVGSVKLMDWRSIENANMATKEFKEQVIQTALAVGTLKKTSKGGIVTNIKGQKAQAVSVKDFNSALSTGWFSKDVLMKTLQQYSAATDIVLEYASENGKLVSESIKILSTSTGKEEWAKTYAELHNISEEAALKKLNKDLNEFSLKAFRAAQEAKTFTEVMDATREAVQTKWSGIFEQIFGNYEEAKVLWSDFAEVMYNAFVAPLDDILEVFKEWKELGGRDDLLDGIYSGFEKIGRLVEPLSEALDDLIPDFTADGLLNFTSSIGRFLNGFIDDIEEVEETASLGMENFDKTAIKLTKGAFAAISKGIVMTESELDKLADTNRIEEVEEAAVKLNKKALTVINKGLVMTESELDKLADIDPPTSIINEFSLFNKTVSTLTDGLVMLKDWADKLKTSFEPVRTSLSRLFSSVKLLVLDALGLLSDVFKDLTNNDDVKNLFDVVAIAVSWATDKLTKFVDYVRLNVLPVIAGVKDSIDISWLFNLKTTVGNIWKFFNNLFATVTTKIKEFASKIDLSKLFGGDGKLDTSDVLKGGYLAAAIVIIKKLLDGLSGFSSAGGIFDKFNSILDSVKTAIDNFSLGSTIQNIKSIAISLLMLAGALVLMSMVDFESVVKSAFVMVAIMGALVFMTNKLMENEGGLKKAGGALAVGSTIAALSSALLMAAVAIIAIGLLPDSVLVKGLAGITLILFEMSIATKWLTTMEKGEKKSIKGAFMVVALAAALLIVALALVVLAFISWDNLAKGLVGIAAVLVELYIFSKLMSKVNKTIGTGVGIFLMASALLVIAAALALISLIDPERLSSAIIAIAAVLAIIGVLASLVNGFSMIGAGVGLIAFAAGIVILTAALFALSLIPLTKILEIALGLIVISGAVWASGMLISTAATALLAAGASLAVFGAGLIVLGLGLAAIAIGAELFVSTLERIWTFLKVIVADVISLIVDFVELLTGWIPWVGKDISAQLSEFKDNVNETLKDKDPTAGKDFGNNIMDGISEGIAEGKETLGDNFMTTVKSAVSESNIQNMGTEAGMSFGTGFLDGIGSDGSVVLDLGFNTDDAQKQLDSFLGQNTADGVLNFDLSTTAGMLSSLQSTNAKQPQNVDNSMENSNNVTNYNNITINGSADAQQTAKEVVRYVNNETNKAKATYQAPRPKALKNVLGL